MARPSLLIAACLTVLLAAAHSYLGGRHLSWVVLLVIAALVWFGDP